MSFIDLALNLGNDVSCKYIHTKTKDQESLLDRELIMRIYTSNLWRRTWRYHLMLTGKWTSKTALCVPVHSMGTDFKQNVITPLITYAYCHGNFI